MPVLFVFAIIFAVLALIAFVVSLAVRDSEEKSGARWTAGVLAGIMALFTLLSSFVSIGTQDVGVKTSFGHPSGGLSNGLHWKAPWEKVTRLDDAIQTDAYQSDGFGGAVGQNADGPCVTVRIARQATACVNVSIRWQIPDNTVDYLFRNFRDNDNIKNKLLHRDLQNAVNTVFADYDPLGLNTNGLSTEPSTQSLSTAVLNELRRQVPQLRIFSIIIPNFYFDDATQTRLNGLQQQVAQTRIAEQAKQTAIQQAKANRELRKSTSNDPGVLTQNCLALVREAVDKNEDVLPAGFQCFAGTGTAVAVK